MCFFDEAVATFEVTTGDRVGSGHFKQLRLDQMIEIDVGNWLLMTKQENAGVDFIRPSFAICKVRGRVQTVNDTRDSRTFTLVEQAPFIDLTFFVGGSAREKLAIIDENLDLISSVYLWRKEGRHINRETNEVNIFSILTLVGVRPGGEFIETRNMAR